MPITINGGQNVFDSSQIIVIYQGAGGGTSYPIKLGALAPNTAGLLYYTGDLLAQYGANAPSPELVGMYVNYDPASDNNDQKICIGVISGQFVNGVTGVDNTTVASATNTFNQVNVLLFSTDVKFYENAITLRNTPAQVTGFKATFETFALDTCVANGSKTSVLKIIGTV